MNKLFGFVVTAFLLGLMSYLILVFIGAGFTLVIIGVIIVGVYYLVVKSKEFWGRVKCHFTK